MCRCPLLLTVTIFMLADAAISPGAEPGNFSRDARIVYETMQLDFARIDAAPAREKWGVLRVVATSGEDNDARRVTALQPPAGEWWVELVAATAEVLDSLSGNVPKGTWPCFVPVPQRIVFGTRPLYTVDLAPGVCICRVIEHPDGPLSRAVLEEAHLIPESWVDHVNPAFDYWKIHRELFTAEQPSPDDRKRLSTLGKDKNPLLAFLACRRLATKGLLLADEVPADELAARDERGVMIDVLLLRHSPKAPDGAAFDRLERLIDAARTVEELHGIALACALELATDHARSERKDRPSFRLLQDIEGKAIELSPDGEPDKYVNNALHDVRRIIRVLDLLERRRATTRPGNETDTSG